MICNVVMLSCKQITIQSGHSQVPPGWPDLSERTWWTRAEQRTRDLVTAFSLSSICWWLILPSQSRLSAGPDPSLMSGDATTCPPSSLLPPATRPAQLPPISRLTILMLEGLESGELAVVQLVIISVLGNNDPLVKACPLTTITKQLDTSCLRPQKSISSPETMSELWGQNTRTKQWAINLCL